MIDWRSVVDIFSLSAVLLTVLSSFLLYTIPYIKSKFSGSQTGKIKLTDNDQSYQLTKKDVLRQQLLEHVRADAPDDGEPVSVQAFWRRVLLPRCALVVVATANLAVQITQTVLHPPPPEIFIRFSNTLIDLSASTYLLVLIGRYALAWNLQTHKSLTRHIFYTSSVYFFHWYVRTLGQYLWTEHTASIQETEYASLALILSQTVLVGMIPVSPQLWVDMTTIYTKAVSTKLHEEDSAATASDDVSASIVDESQNLLPRSEKRGNVTNELSGSLLSQLLYTFVYPMIRKTSQMSQVDIHHLPALEAPMRTQNMYHEFMGSPSTTDSVNKWSRHPTLSLLWTVWWPHRRAVVTSFTISLALCPLWYLPHICLQQILSILDAKSASRWSAVAFGALMIFAKLFNSMLSMKQYRLTLDQESMLLAPSFSIKSGPSGRTFTGLFKAALDMVMGCSYVWILLGPSGLWGLSTLILICPPAYILTKWEYKIYEKRLEIMDERIGLMQEAIQAISMIKMMAAERFWFGRINDVRQREFKKIIQAKLLAFVSGFLYSAAPNIVVIVSFAHYTLVAKKELTATVAFTSIAVFNELRPVLLDLPQSTADLLQQILGAKRIAKFLSAKDVDYLNEPASSPGDQDGGEGGDGDMVDDSEPLHIIGTVGWHTSQDEQIAAATEAITKGKSKGLNSSTSSQNISGSVTPVPPKETSFKLHDLWVQFPRGEMTLIAGKFGSGMSLLLLALLGEASLIEGKISYTVSPLMDPTNVDKNDWSLQPKGVAYVPQIPWLLSQSIRENILFGLPMNFERYRSVCFATGLMPDLELLEDADLTEIGERGKILSGGQKARVSLARAVYSRASTLLLDDVISAVDAQTSQHIIQHCFNSPLMAGRTIIIASHAVEALAPLSPNAIYLDDGRCVWSGTGRELLNSAHMAHLQSERSLGDSQSDADQGAKKTEEDTDIGLGTAENTLGSAETQAQAEQFEMKEATPKTPRQIVLEEEREKGTVDMEHWRNLLAFNGKTIYWTVVTVLFLVSSLSPVAERKVLSLWTGSEGDDGSKHTVAFWVTLYALVSISRLLLNTTFGLFRFFGGIRATKLVHGQMLESMLRTKMVFFTKTRAGSIVQRFGQDLNKVMPCSTLVGSLGRSFMSIIVSLVSVSVYGGWPFCLITLALLVAGWMPARWYRASSRQVRRLQAVIPGPINAIFGETVAGTAVIRAFGTQSIFLDELMRSINMKIVANVTSINIARWLYMNMQIMNIIVRATALILLLSVPSTTGATAGFVLTFANSISTYVNSILVNIRNFELNGVSLERTSEYRILEREIGGALRLNDTTPPSWLNRSHHDDDDDEEETSLGKWPDKGQLNVKDVCARYGPDMPEILHDVSFEVEAGERVGIVGATGGGKSTLAKAFFSFVDLTKGSIEIDGKDISDIPLGQVRSKLGIIAQDPILLSGTLRLNLDIEGQYSDEQLYDVLHQVQLLKRDQDSTATATAADDDVAKSSSTSSSSSVTAVEGSVTDQNTDHNQSQSIFTNLDYKIKSGGENLSAGQKQLVVLARALLKKHRVLILDEATASIDSATDAEISRVVHEEFHGATVLIIAHRLRTIMPCSKILVMDQGRLIQQGSPVELIQEQGGKFHQLCMAAGQDEFEHLKSLAQQFATQASS